MQINTFMMFVFAAYLLLIAKGNMLLNKMLGILFFNRMMLNLFFLVVFGPWSAFFSRAIMFVPVISMLSAPIAYFYVRNYINDDTKLHKRDWLHLLPIIVCIINIIPALFSSDNIPQVFFQAMESKVNNSQLTLFLPFRFQFAIRSFLMIAYSGYSFFILIKKIQLKEKPLFRSAKNWLISFLLMTIILNVISALLTWGFVFEINTRHGLLENNLIMVIFSVLLICYMLYPVWQPVVLYGNMLPKVVASSVSVNETEAIKDAESTSFTLPEQQSLLYKDHLTNLMTEETPYLNPELTLSLLAGKLNIPQHHLSYLLNQVINQSFRDYINHYRIAHFIRDYAANIQHFTLESMSQQVGFKTYRTFLNAFKKETGDTPAAYFQKMVA